VVRAVVRAYALCQIGVRARGGAGGARCSSADAKAIVQERHVNIGVSSADIVIVVVVVDMFGRWMDGMEEGGEEEAIGEEQKVEAPLK
jgi:hypothetical protein